MIIIVRQKKYLRDYQQTLQILQKVLFKFYQNKLFRNFQSDAIVNNLRLPAPGN